MYGKLFESIYDGTLVEDWKALVTFQQMIILCDQDGILDMTAGAMSRRTGIPLEIIKQGIEILENPDKASRSPKESGKRIIRLNDHRDWGWQIVNHKHYRDLRTANDKREYMRVYMQEKRAKEKLTKPNKSLHVSDVGHKDTNTYTNTYINTKPKIKTKAAPFIVPENIDAETLKAFIEHRQKLKAPMTDRAKTLLINRLNKLNGNNNDILNQSIINGWKGVFELKEESTDEKTNAAGNDTRSRAKKVSDELDNIAREAANRGERI